MFATLSRSWEFAKTSYGILWGNKRLIVLPLLSGAAALLVMASFAVPLWQSGTLETWMETTDGEAGGHDPVMYATLFAFYFCNYFVIVFFNTALVACAMQALAGEEPTLGYGLSIATKRIGPIFGWALISAVIGLLLRIIENSNKRAARFISGIMGMAWTALTYMVVPVIAVEGVGPIKAFKRSIATLRQTWGTALVGNFSLGFLGFLVMLPVFLVAGLIVYLAAMNGSPPALAMGIAVAVLLVVLAVAATSAADMIFKAVLFSYATGKTLPADIDASVFPDAFSPRD